MIDTNGNLILSPNGVGVIQTNNTLVPRLTRTYDLGSANLQYRTVYANTATFQTLGVAGDFAVSGNLTVAGNIIQVGNIVTDSLTIQLANTATTANAANGSGVTVGSNDNIATLLYNSTGNVWTTNIGLSATGNITAPYFFGNGSQLTGVVSSYGNSNVTTLLGNLGSNTISGTGNITTTANISGGFFIGNGAFLTGIVSSYGNANVVTLLAGFGSNTISTTGNISGGFILGNLAFANGLPATYSNANAVAYGESGWAGNIIPAGNAVYSLGNATNQWNDLYVSNATIFMNNVPISLGAGNVLTVGGNAVLQNNSNSSISTTGNITAGNIGITGGSLTWANASIVQTSASDVSITGDGQVTVRSLDGTYQWTFDSNGTLTLPGAAAGETIATSGGYITVGNLLIGQGGALFNSNNDSWALYGNRSDPGATILIPSNADAGNGTPLYIESQQSNVEIRSGSSTWNFGNTGVLTAPGNVSATGNITGNYFIGNGSQLTGISSGVQSRIANGTSNVNIATANGNATITANAASTWTFGTGGTTQFPNSVILAPVSQSITMQSDQYSQLMWVNANVTVAPNTAVNSNFYVASNSATLDIVYRDGSSTQQQKSWLWGVDGTLTLPTAGRINFDYLSISSDANVSAFYAPAGNVQLAAGIGDAQIVANSLNDSKTWTFGNTGNLTIPGSINFANGVNILSTVAGTYGNTQVAAYLPTYTGNITAGNLTITGNLNQPNRGFGNGPGTNLYITAGHTQGCSIPGGNTIISGGLGYNGIAHNGGNVTLRTGDYYSKQWNFDYAGNLTLPAGGVIAEGGGLTGAIRLTPAGGANANQALLIYPTGVAEGDHIHLTAGGGSTELYLGNDFHYVKLVDGGNIELRAATANLSAQAAWTFDTTGNIDTIQALGIKVPDGVPTNVAIINSTTGSWEANPMSNLATTGGTGSGLTVNVAETGGYASTIEIATAGTGYTNGDLITVTSGTSNATFTIVIGGRNSWRFGIDGNLTLPQTGYLKVGSGIVPAFISSPAPIITGFSNISAQNFTFLANGVNILSAVGAYQTFANANAATQATSINTINNTLTSANVGIGLGAGATSQGTSAVAIGEGAGSLDQGLYSVAIGNDAGAQYQGNIAVAVGAGAGKTNQGDYAVAIGRNAGYTNQGNNSIIINATTGTLNQTRANTFTVAPVRNDVANVAQVMFYNTTSKEVTYGNTISIAGNINASQFNFANGVNILSTVGAGSYGNAEVAAYLLNFDGDIEFTSSTAKIGNVDVITVGDHIRSPAYQFSNGTSIFSGITGTYSNTNVASYLTTATITTTGNITAGNLTTSGTFTVANITTTGAYGNITGANVISANTVSATNYLFANGVNILSTVAGTYGNANVTSYFQSLTSLALGSGAGATAQGVGSVALGVNAGNDQGYYAVAIGIGSGRVAQADSAVAIGGEAGWVSQGINSVAVGYRAGTTNQANSSIILNATGANLNATTANTFTVAPVRNDVANVAQVLFYNTTSKEITYGNTISIAGNLAVAGNVVQQSAYYETYSNVTNSGGNLTCNFVNGATFYATLTANVTVNFTNVVATAGRVTGATLIVDQDATAYRVANIQINSGGIQTIKYAGGTPNTGTASNTDVMSFSLISLDGTNWRILGQIANYG